MSDRWMDLPTGRRLAQLSAVFTLYGAFGFAVYSLFSLVF